MLVLASCGAIFTMPHSTHKRQSNPTWQLIEGMTRPAVTTSPAHLLLLEAAVVYYQLIKDVHADLYTADIPIDVRPHPVFAAG